MDRLTLEQFGAQVRISESYACYVKNGRRLPSGDLLVRIILAFELEPVPAMKAYQDGREAFGKFIRETVFVSEPEPVPGEQVTVPAA
jgi:hypothetical protein